MKKTTRKLELTRPTIRPLAADQLSTIQGGGGTTAPPTTTVWKDGNIASLDDWQKVP